MCNLGRSRSSVYLEDRNTGEFVEAVLCDPILANHLDDFDRLWMTISPSGQHLHWDWRQKTADYSGQLSYQSFAIECEGKTQGLMIVNTIKRCRLPHQSNKHLVYVEYLQSAPWNRSGVSAPRNFRGIGTVMIAAAVQLSLDEGNHGRIGLHSLPQADSFYRDECNMTDLGPDNTYANYPLSYFEMTEQQAADFLQHTRRTP